MKKTPTLSHNSNTIEANNRSQNSNRAAKAARIAKEELNRLLAILDEWSQIFSNSSVALGTSLFMFATAMELFFSWPMYIDMMSQMTGKANNVLAGIGGGFLVLWGAYVSHLIAKRMSPAMVEYHTFNILQNKDNKLPIAAAKEKAKIAMKRDFILGLILGILLLLIVAAISWQRVWLITDITGVDYSLMHKLLPVICVLIEIVSGIFISYLRMRIKTIIKVNKLKKRFEKEKSICAFETMMAQEYHTKAEDDGEKAVHSKELSDALFRYEHRSQDNDNYVDEIPSVKTLKIIVANQNGMLSGVHLAGVLSNGEYCNTIKTNEKGEGTLSWHGESSEMLKVYTDNIPHLGPFRENSSIRIDLN